MRGAWFLVKACRLGKQHGERVPHDLRAGRLPQGESVSALLLLRKAALSRRTHSSPCTMHLCPPWPACLHVYWQALEECYGVARCEQLSTTMPTLCWPKHM